jgi:hypothetical protein
MMGLCRVVRGGYCHGLGFGKCLRGLVILRSGVC